MYSKKISRFEILFLGVVFAVFICIGLSGDTAMAQCQNDDEFTTEFYLDDCGGFSHNTDTNPFFILKNGYTLRLVGEEDGDDIEVVITVLNEIEPVDGVNTRVVEEREWVGDELVEISRNYFAICNRTNAVYYFGELSQECEGGFEDGDFCPPERLSEDGSWRAGEDGAMPGLIMPGTFLLGSKYFQEIAWDDDAVDRGENVEMGLTVPDPEGGADFEGCVMVVDTNPAEGVCKTKDGDVKIYCPGIGLVQDEELELNYYGYGPPPE